MRAALLKNLRLAASRRAGATLSRPVLGLSTPSVQVAASIRAFASANAGSTLSLLTKENPHVDVVRYEHKNRKWSLNHVEYYSEALAIGLVEKGLIPGDVVLCYLPLHFSEAVSPLACRVEFVVEGISYGNLISNPNDGTFPLCHPLDGTPICVFQVGLDLLPLRPYCGRDESRKGEDCS